MILSWRILLVGMVLLFAVGQSGGEDCPEMEKLRDFYKAKRFISLKFTQLTYSDIFETVDTLRGALLAGRGTRFRLSMPEQVLVSNGILYWSFSEANQQVLVDSVTKRGEWNPLTIFYDPEQVYTCRDQKKSEGIIQFEMYAVDSMTAPLQFSMQMSPEEFIPQKLIYFDDNDSRIEVFIEEFSRPDTLPESSFEFVPGPDIEVIEMP
jgi:outer membrane lipoprotein-sorting protein